MAKITNPSTPLRIDLPAPRSLDKLKGNFQLASHMLDSQLSDVLCADAEFCVSQQRLHVKAGGRRYHWHDHARVWSRSTLKFACSLDKDPDAVSVREILCGYEVKVLPQRPRGTIRRTFEMIATPGPCGSAEDPLGTGVSGS